MYALNGRTFHRFPSLGTKNGVDEPLFFQHHDTPSQYVRLFDVRTLRDYMIHNNSLALKLQFISDLHYGTYSATTAHQLSALYEGHRVLNVHADDLPSNAREAYVVHGTSVDPMRPPMLEGFVLSKEGSSDDVNLLSMKETSHLWDTAQYSLLYPTGRGGWWKEGSYPFSLPHYRASVLAPVFGAHAQTVTCGSISDFLKYLLYQKSSILLTVPTCLQQYILDSFSRWQSLNYQAMLKQPEVTNSIRGRIAHYNDIMANVGDSDAIKSKSLPSFINACVPGSPAHQKKEIRNALSVFARKGNLSHLPRRTTGLTLKELCPGIPDSLFPVEHYPDVMARVFRQRLADVTERYVMPKNAIYSAS